MAAMPREGTDGGGQPRMRTPVPVRGEGGGAERQRACARRFLSNQAGPGRAEAAAEPGARVDVQPGEGPPWAGPGRGPAPGVGDGRRAYGFSLFGLQAEPRGEQHRVGQQDGLLGRPGAGPRPAPRRGAHLPEGAAERLREEGQRPAGPRHGAEGAAQVPGGGKGGEMGG